MRVRRVPQLVFYMVIFEPGSPCSPSSPRTCHIDQAHRCHLPASGVLGLKVRHHDQPPHFFYHGPSQGNSGLVHSTVRVSLAFRVGEIVASSKLYPFAFELRRGGGGTETQQ